MSASAWGSQPAKAASPPSVDDPWGELMAAAQAGNGGAYRRLLTEVDVWLRRYYARRLPPAIVEDAAQDTLLTIHARRHTYEPGRPFKAWLAGIARYKWIDRLRALAREPAVSLEDDVAEDLAVDDHGAAVTSAIVLQELMGRLKPAQAEVIRLVKLQGFSVEEASIRTGQSVSLVKVNIHRGLARLSAIVEVQTG
jgi:RNA polymerase sigma-70 factor (ECF subfamily)